MNILEFIVCLFVIALIGSVRHPFICLMAVLLFIYIKHNTR